MYNVLVINGSENAYGWTDGSVDVAPFIVEASSKTKVVLELDWDDFFAREITKDFSLVVFGSDGAVSIDHMLPAG